MSNICEEAGIPIVRFWTSYGVNAEYIKGKISETLNSLPITRKHHFARTKPEPSPAPVLHDEPLIYPVQQPVMQKKKGCYIATCVYGSYDCSPVWTLRRYRDYTLSKTWYGRTFIRVYYAISPTLVKIFGNQNWFKKAFKNCLDTIVEKLQSKGYNGTSYKD